MKEKLFALYVVHEVVNNEKYTTMYFIKRTEIKIC